MPPQAPLAQQQQVLPLPLPQAAPLLQATTLLPLSLLLLFLLEPLALLVLVQRLLPVRLLASTLPPAAAPALAAAKAPILPAHWCCCQLAGRAGQPGPVPHLCLLPQPGCRQRLPLPLLVHERLLLPQLLAPPKTPGPALPRRLQHPRIAARWQAV